MTRGVSILTPIVAAVLAETVGGLGEYYAPAQSHLAGCGLLDQFAARLPVDYRYNVP
jgi:hypothetical protein